MTTFPNRVRVRRSIDADLVRFGLGLLARVAWKVGVRADYRRVFWDVARPLLREGRIEEIVQLAIVGRHLIRFSRDCLAGAGEASFYADPSRTESAGVPRAAAAG